MATIRPRGGKWQVRWREGGKAVDPARSETFDTKRQADRFKGLVDGHGQRTPEGWVKGVGFVKVESGDGPTLAEWFERAIAARTQANERSKHDARRDFTNHVPEWLSTMPIGKITREDAGLWVNELRVKPRGGKGKLRDKPMSAKSIHNIHGHVSGVMNDALRDAHIARNPFYGLLKGTSKKPAEEMVCLTPEEFVILRDEFIEYYHPFLTLLYATGLRFSEATALGPEHIDVRKQTLRVDRAWKRNAPPLIGEYLGQPKTDRAYRTIGLNGGLMEMLAPLLAAARTRVRKPGEPALVFVNKTGGRIQNGSFHVHQWIPAVDRASEQGLTQRPRIHDLRHSHASLMLAEGNSMYAVSRRLGHASIQTTDQRYSHLLPEVDELMRSSLDRVPLFAPKGLRVVESEAS